MEPTVFEYSALGRSFKIAVPVAANAAECFCIGQDCILVHEFEPFLRATIIFKEQTKSLNQSARFIEYSGENFKMLVRASTHSKVDPIRNILENLVSIVEQYKLNKEKEKKGDNIVYLSEIEHISDTLRCTQQESETTIHCTECFAPAGIYWTPTSTEEIDFCDANIKDLRTFTCESCQRTQLKATYLLGLRKYLEEAIDSVDQQLKYYGSSELKRKLGGGASDDEELEYEQINKRTKRVIEKSF